MTVTSLTDRLLKTNNAEGPERSFEEALEQLDQAVSALAIKAFEIYAEQVTFACTQTGKWLFDDVRARLLRERLSKHFNAILESCDDEREEELTPPPKAPKA